MNDLLNIKVKIYDGEPGVYFHKAVLTRVLPDSFSMDMDRTIEQNLPQALREPLKGRNLSIKFNAMREKGCFDLDDTDEPALFKPVPCDIPVAIPGCQNWLNRTVPYTICIETEEPFLGQDTVINIIHFMLEHLGVSVVIGKEAFDELVANGIPDTVIVDWIGRKLPVIGRELTERDEEIEHLTCGIEEETGVRRTR